MHDTSEHSGLYSKGRWIIRGAACAVFAVLIGGCAEFAHMGRMNDREYATAVAGVQIEQQQEDGTWKKLGETDGSGKWFILKSQYKGGGRIRLSKKGYGTQVMTDNEFIQASNMLMAPNNADQSDTNSPWR